MDLKDTLIRLLGLENILAHLTGYVEAKMALIKLEVREEVSHVVSKGMVAVVLFFFAFLFLLFVSLAAVHVINAFAGNAWAGYVWVAGFYGCLFLFFLLFRKSIEAAMESRMRELIKRKESKS
jgi:hypothetical protein